ncbi:hypothetical protein TNCT_394481 [Trichonephila clavata]|uniref:Uncharacterized protein n=1 Tax=Trichonephila clavata TaxID=2740835 RepID=A0A8X6HL01_TRICU|nr:hypothetical protein TNCT_394481 [Trichonephila clavata]
MSSNVSAYVTYVARRTLKTHVISSRRGMAMEYPSPIHTPTFPFSNNFAVSKTGAKKPKGSNIACVKDKTPLLDKFSETFCTFDQTIIKGG